MLFRSAKLALIADQFRRVNEKRGLPFSARDEINLLEKHIADNFGTDQIQHVIRHIRSQHRKDQKAVQSNYAREASA